MSANNRRQVTALRERVSRLTGQVQESDMHVVHIVATGDPEENVYVLPAYHGRYKYFHGKQWDEIAGIMRANGYTADGHHRWKVTISPEAMARRDEDAAVQEVEELVVAPAVELDDSIR